MYVRVCHMCQKFKIPCCAVKFPFLTLSYLYIDQKIGNFLMFRYRPKWFSVLLYSLLIRFGQNHIWLKKFMKEIDQPPNLYIIYVVGLPRLPQKKFGVWGPTPYGCQDPHDPQNSLSRGPGSHIGGGVPDPQIFFGKSRKYHYIYYI